MNKMNKSKYSRRSFLTAFGMSSAAVASSAHQPIVFSNKLFGGRSLDKKTLREFVEIVRYRVDEVDEFLDDTQPNWGKYDEELGYIVSTYSRRDGIEG